MCVEFYLHVHVHAHAHVPPSLILPLYPSLSLSFPLFHSLSLPLFYPSLLTTTKYQNYHLSLLLSKHNVMHVHVHITCTYACTCMYTSMSFTCGDTDNYRTHTVHVTTTCISFLPSLPKPHQYVMKRGLPKSSSYV